MRRITFIKKDPVWCYLDVYKGTFKVRLFYLIYNSVLIIFQSKHNINDDLKVIGVSTGLVHVSWVWNIDSEIYYGIYLRVINIVCRMYFLCTQLNLKKNEQTKGEKLFIMTFLKWVFSPVFLGVLILNATDMASVYFINSQVSHWILHTTK